MKWFKAEASGEGCANVWINKPIGSDWAPDWVNDLFGEQSAREFIDTIESLGELSEITVHLNCPGGDVASGIAIMNYLKNHKATIHMRVEGMAASIASVVLMAGDTRTMAIGSTVMVHDPMGWMSGYYTEHEMRDRADQMSKIKAACVEAYVAGTGKSSEEISELLSNGDTYLTSDEAMDWGFATAKDDTLRAIACSDMGQFKQQFALAGKLHGKEEELKAKNEEIESLKNQILDLTDVQVPDAQAVIDACKEVQLPTIALALIESKCSENELQSKISFASEIRDICKASGLEETEPLSHINDYSAMIRTMVLNTKASLDDDLDHHQSPRSGATKQPNARAAYDQLNNHLGG